MYVPGEDPISDKVYKEQMAYNAIRYNLCETENADKAVLFENGKVVDFFDTEISAYLEGLRLFGNSGGFIIDIVAPERVVYLRSPRCTT